VSKLVNRAKLAGAAGLAGFVANALDAGTLINRIASPAKTLAHLRR
jgi:hypothetical protein